MTLEDIFGSHEMHEREMKFRIDFSEYLNKIGALKMKEELNSKIDSMETELNTLKIEITSAYDAIHDVSQRFQMIRQYFLSIKSDIDVGDK